MWNYDRGTDNKVPYFFVCASLTKSKKKLFLTVNMTIS